MIEIVGKPIILEDYRMKQRYTDKRMGICLTLHGDDYLPYLTLLAEKGTKPIGVWGKGVYNI